jgi:hypothetical protein
MDLLQGFTQFVAVRKPHFLPLELWIQIYCVGSKSFTAVPNLTLTRSSVFLFWRWRTPPPPSVGQGFLIHKVSRSHTTTYQSVGLLWTSDQIVAETSTWQDITLRTDNAFIPPLGFEPTFSVGERSQTYFLYRAATENGHISFDHSLFGLYFYRVIPEHRLLCKKEVCMNMWLILNGYRDRAVWISRPNSVRFLFVGLDEEWS